MLREICSYRTGYLALKTERLNVRSAFLTAFVNTPRRLYVPIPDEYNNSVRALTYRRSYDTADFALTILHPVLYRALRQSK